MKFLFLSSSLFVLLLVGCLQLPKPEPSAVRYFVLPDFSSTVSAHASAAEAPATVGLILDSWPEYLQRKQIVLFDGVAEMRIMQDFVWAESLRNASLSRFLLALQQSYPNTQWQPAPWTDRPPDVLCILDIHHWKAHADGTVELQGNWRFVERASGTVLNSGPFRNSSTWELASFASLAATKSRQLTEVSNQILLYAQ